MADPKYDVKHDRRDVYLNGHYVGTLPNKEHKARPVDSNQISSVFHLFIVFILVVGIFMVLFGSVDEYQISVYRDENNNMIISRPEALNLLGFEDLLRLFTEVPDNYQIKTQWISEFSKNVQIEGSWDFSFSVLGVQVPLTFEWLRNFLNRWVMPVIIITVTVFTGLGQTLAYLFYFVQQLLFV